MDTAQLIVLSQAVGSLLVLGVQTYLVGGLKSMITDQSNVIKALKDQADGQIALTKEISGHATIMSTRATGMMEEVDKRVALARSIAEDEAQLKFNQQQEKAVKEVKEASEQQLETIASQQMQTELAAVLRTVVTDLSELKQAALKGEYAAAESISRWHKPTLKGVLEIMKAINQEARVHLGMMAGSIKQVQWTSKQHYASIRFFIYPLIIREFPALVSYYGLDAISDALDWIAFDYYSAQEEYYKSMRPLNDELPTSVKEKYIQA